MGSMDQSIDLEGSIQQRLQRTQLTPLTHTYSYCLLINTTHPEHRSATTGRGAARWRARGQWPAVPGAT